MSDTREHNVLRALPFFILFILLLFMSVMGYDGYRRSHVKPKPEPIPVNNHVGNIGTVWLACNAGMAVTDLKDCPEYKVTTEEVILSGGRKITILRDHGTCITFIRPDLPLWETCEEADAFIAWDKKHPEVQQPRKHKRKATDYPFKFGGDFITFETDGRCDREFTYDEKTGHCVVAMLTILTRIPLTCDPLSPLDERQQQRLTCWYLADKPVAEKKADCPVAPVGDGDFYIDSDGCLRVAFTPMPGTCGADEECVWSMAHVTPDKPIAEKPRAPCPGGCDDGWDVEENAYACVKDGLTQPPSQKSCAELGLKPAKWPTIASVQIVLTQKQKDAYPSNAWMKPCGPDNQADGCYMPDPPTPAEPKPDCKMPADIDVCPIQMLDPKERHD